jgi:hypothetical protein
MGMGTSKTSNEHRVIAMPLTRKSIFAPEDVNRFNPMSLVSARAEDLPYMRRSVVRVVYQYGDYTINLFDPQTFTGLTARLQDELTDVGIISATPSNSGIHELEQKIREGTLTSEQLRKLDEIVARYQEHDLAAYKEEIGKLVSTGAKAQRDHRGRDTTQLEELAPLYLNRSKYIVITDKSGDVLVTFRIINAPYGRRFDPAISGAVFGTDPHVGYGFFGPDVIGRSLSEWERLLYPDWLATQKHHKLFDPFVSRYGPTKAEYGKMAPPAFEFFDWIQKASIKGEVPDLMMERIIKKFLLENFENGRLPRPADPYMYMTEGGPALMSGNIAEWGALYIKPGTPGEVVIGLLTNILTELYDWNFNQFHNHSAQRAYTYSNAAGFALFSRLGFKKLIEKSFQNPFSDVPEEWWVLVATPTSVAEAFRAYQDRGAPEEKEKMNTLIEDFLKDNGLRREDLMLFGLPLSGTSGERSP